MLSKGKNLLLEAKVETCRLYMCVLVIVGAESRQNAECGLCAVRVRSLFSAGHTGEDHNKVNKRGREMRRTTRASLGQCGMFLPCLERP